MKKVIITCCIIAIVVIGLLQTGVLNSLMLFLLVGAIPGTSYSIPSSFMLLLIACVTWLIIFRFAALEAFFSISAKRSAKKHIERKKRMPKRRFGEI